MVVVIFWKLCSGQSAQEINRDSLHHKKWEAGQWGLVLSGGTIIKWNDQARNGSQGKARSLSQIVLRFSKIKIISW